MIRSYDFLDNQKVQCFRYEHILESGNHVILGGNMTSFRIGDRIPWKTFYYNYSPEFLIIDATNKAKLITHYISMGIYQGSFTGGTIPSVVIDTYGNKLNIKTLCDIDEYYQCYQECDDYYSEQLNQIILSKSAKKIASEEYFKNQINKCQSRAFSSINKKWKAKKAMLAPESLVGAFIYSYVFAENEEEKTAIKKLFFDYIDKDKLCVENYISWFNKDISAVFNHHYDRGLPLFIDITETLSSVLS